MTFGVEPSARLDFVLALRRRWADTLYPHLRREFEARGGDESRPPSALADDVHALPSYGWFAWLERGSQKMLWRAVVDAIAGRQDQAADGSISPETTDAASGRPALDPALVLPDYYTEWDIHLQPGGVWSSRASADVYELGAKLVMMGENDDYKFHRLFVETALAPRPYKRIVDLGCGFGKSTWPLKAAFPTAEVVGVDVSAPCLELAGERAAARQLAISFRQADACATGLEGGAFDLVTSTMLVHELPHAALIRLLREAARLLAPGGVLAFLDFQPTGDGFRDLSMIEHSARNNEPFMAPMMAMDLVREAEAAGLRRARWTAFDERGAGELAEPVWPRRAEWHFPWAVFHAEAPR